MPNNVLVFCKTGYAWLHCEREEDADCADVMLKAGIIGRPGTEFGASSRYVRLALLDRQSSFDNLAARLSDLAAQP
jgi:aspartate/methionine/tyrosine aminotransferase